MHLARRLSLVLALLCGGGACDGKSFLGRSNPSLGDGGDSAAEPIEEQCFSRFADGKLGSECAGNPDCEAGLECITAGSGAFAGEGPARGYCTKACTVGSFDCVELGYRAACVTFEAPSLAGYCFEGCTVGSGPGVSKCHGRSEVACVSDFPDNGTSCRSEEDCAPRVCSPTGPDLPAGRCGTVTCQPRCNTDADCGRSLFCNRFTGLCSATPRTGLPVGEPCDGTADCRGWCIPVGYRPGGDLFHVCTEDCTMGAVATCGWGGPGTGRAEAHCITGSQANQAVAFAPGCKIPSLDAQFPDYATGDDGACLKLCECNADCKVDGSRCHELDPAVQQATGRRGVCLGLISPEAVDPGIATCP